MSNPHTFGDQVRLARQQANLTQVGLAARVDIAQAHLSSIENGGTASRAVARAICNELGLGPAWTAVAVLEDFAAKQARDFGVAPSDTFAELSHALHERAAVVDAFLASGGSKAGIAALEGAVARRAHSCGASLQQGAGGAD
jgi:transcriptional regulator with XRE-family HTH domain